MSFKDNVENRIEAITDRLEGEDPDNEELLQIKSEIIEVLQTVLEGSEDDKIDLKEADSLFGKFLPFTHRELDDELSDIICCGAILNFHGNIVKRWDILFPN
ncbi:MAG: hypothetical protein ABEK17_02205 [Candidatus Aenigmatarchaeota archaeon]